MDFYVDLPKAGYIILKQIIQSHKRKVITMAKPIELGFVLEGEDAKEFFRNERNPIVSKKLVEMFKRAKKINEQNRS